jgi:hypothetical protein
MRFGNNWSRRRFLAVSGAVAAQAVVERKGLTQTQNSAADAVAARKANAQEAAAAMPPPGVITGGVQPLMQGHTARPLRYRPVGGEFVIHNGGEFFNRPIYGPNNDFRVDAGDLPEFSLYLPGHGGNLKLGFIVAGTSKWAAQAKEVIARYRPGRMIYEVRDTLLGKGALQVELLTAGEGSGLMLKIEGRNFPKATRLAWAFAGVSGRKGRRNGDIGCEVEPVSRFFQVRAEECDGNSYAIESNAASLKARAANLALQFPAGSLQQVEEFSSWTNAPKVLINAASGATPKQPILIGSVELSSTPLFLSVNRISPDASTVSHLSEADLAKSFASRSTQVDAIAQTLNIDTPDEYVNAAGAALGVAADTIWDEKQQCVMHGGVAWRQALAGWRGPYSLDALGNHDRAKNHFRHWLKRQNVTPITTADPATGPWDANIHLARKEKLLHSNGDISNNHYDMNLVFMDVLLRHLMWTGDLTFAREVWPALRRHLAWERRLFRRTYTNATGKELPLYEAYAAIWASDNLQYNGGGAAHSSAYNVFALRAAAKLARALGEDGAAYDTEAELIQQAMQELLWLPEQGAFGESKDILEPQTVYSNPALWTVYHTIDSGVPTLRQAWQMAAERLAVLKHVPIHGDGVPEGDWYMLSCSDWLPYIWSLNLLLLAENAHMALALWQTGMSDQAWRIFKGTLLDSMYMGLCPGDFHMTSALDVHRQEAQRDFGDPIGISSRALVEGLFGVQPDLLTGEIRIRPGFPSEWERASLRHKDFDFTWHRDKQKETYEFTGRFAKPVPLNLTLPARTTSFPEVKHNGKGVPCEFDQMAVGEPRLRIHLPAAPANNITIKWSGNPPAAAPPHRSYSVGEMFDPPHGVSGDLIDDPQKALSNGRITAAGFHTVFANVRDRDCAWSMPISFDVTPQAVQFPAVPHLDSSVAGEQIDLALILKDRITEIFTRLYPEPRSPYCSLAFPDNLLGGWANPDGRATIDDAGLRATGGLLHTALGVDFGMATVTDPNCLFLSHWDQDQPQVRIALTGRAHGLYLLLAGTTFPQCSRMQHATITVTYKDDTLATLALRNPENWWPVEQDYLLDDYLFVSDAPPPPRVDLRTAQTRVLDPASFRGKGRTVPGGSANIVHLPLDQSKELASLRIEVELYGVVIALMAATLARA